MSSHELVVALRFVHVIGALTFLLAHGTAATIAFRLRKEKDHVRIGALLDASADTLPMMGIAWVALIVSGVAMAALAGALGSGWFLASIAVFLVVTFSMTPLASPYARSRGALGLKIPTSSKKVRERMAQFKPEDVERFLAEAKPALIAAVGYGGTILLVFLMMFKPF